MVNRKENISTSLDIFSTLITSLVEITVFITGCFKCSKNSDYYHKNERDRAWFDDQRVQTEQPYCYVNPVATHTVSTKDQQKYDKITNDTHAGNIGLDKLDINNWRGIPNTSDKKEISLDFLDSHCYLSPYKNEQKSFALNVEEEYIDSKKNSFRCEGDSSLKIINPGSPLKRGKMMSPVAHRKIWHQLSNDRNDIDWDNVSFDSSIEDDISLDQYHLFDDIWRSCELENAFIDYNIAAFNGHGWNSINQANAGRKSPSEKFEDIFPSRKYLEAKISENMDSTSSYESESDFSLTKTSTCSNFSVVKFPNNFVELNDLSQLIDACICSNTKDNLEDNISNNKRLKQFCDSDFTICGKTYSTTLLYDLVRQIMLDNFAEYPSSANLSKLIPLNNVKNKVYSVMNIRRKDDTNANVESNFVKTFIDIEKPSDFIDRIINDEIICETKNWLNFEIESSTMKESIYKQIYNDLIESATNDVSLVLSKKLYFLNL